MRRTPYFLGVFCLLLSACSNSTEPRIYSIAGTWRSVGLAGVDIEMTLVETARAIVGAGYWTTATTSDAFRTSGANVGTSASLLLDFDGREDVNFTGRFEEESDETRLVGTLHGGGFRAQPVSFQLVEEDD